ncbi:MAG: SCO family protein [Chloroflexota bacterium]
MAGPAGISGGDGDTPTAILDGAFRIVVFGAVLLVVLMVVRLIGDATTPTSPGGATVPSSPPVASATNAVDVSAYLLASPRPAPALELTGPGGQAVSLAALRGTPVLVFFGYTHCPDVCPATIGTVGEAIDAAGDGARAVFASVDPERDTPAWLAEFVAYMPDGFSAATGSPSQVAATAAAWGVRYAKVDADGPERYSMSHTADVFLVDRAGLLRAVFPFGTEAVAMTATMRYVDEHPQAAAPTPGPEPSATPTVAPSAVPVDLWPQVVSSSVWAGGASPLILTLHDAGGPVDDPALVVTARLVTLAGIPVTPPVPATAVQPSGLDTVSWVATLDIPTPGAWRVDVLATAPGGEAHHGVADLVALDQGASAALGGSAPTIRTQTATDVGGDLTYLSTDALPDPRLSQTSTADALAAGRPFVLVVDSAAFKVTPACGRALALAKRLLDRWRDVPFIHHEPYRYDVITTEPVLEGTLEDPRLTDVAQAWGVGDPPWGVGSMPWVFIADGDGVVRAKYQGVLGSADIDVMLSLLEAED